MNRNAAAIFVRLAVLAGAALMLATAAFAAQQSPAKPVIAKICTSCHKAEANTLRGYFDNVAFKAHTIQIKIDDTIELVKFDKDDLKVVTAEGKAMDGKALHKTKKGHEIKIEFDEKNGVKTALRLVEKPPVKIPQKMLITTADMEKLVRRGPEKGRYFLFDSRPLPRFQEGAIPTAVNLPYPAFDKLVDKLPKDKSALIIFYCAGVNCNMSPGSADKAKKLGYTNIKVYRDGIPAWSEKNYTVLPPQYLKEAWIDKDIPHVLLDVRPGKEAAHGFIKGAVSFPVAQSSKLLSKLPPKEKKPPIIIYDGKEGKQAERVAKYLLKAGFGNVKILIGGFDGWKAAKFESATGKLAARADYAPKPRPGEISMDEFKKYATALPPDVIILDVRNADEVKSGMLKTAIHIPMEELRDHIAEIPKDKLVITHCSTGIRAEMAYNVLKELGFSKIKYLNAKIQFEKGNILNIANN